MVTVMLQPKLLIGNGPDPETLAELVCTNPVSPLDTVMPTARFRGTLIRKESSGGITVVGWQRNYARIRQVDVSLPTIITARISPVNDEGVRHIESISLDPRFRGSKGILCSASYLDRTLQEVLTGRPFGRSLHKQARLENLHCFHSVEVIGGMTSFYDIMAAGCTTATPGTVFYEEETSDYLCKDAGRSDLCGYHIMNEVTSVRYLFSVDDLFERVAFAGNGGLLVKGPLPVSFAINDAVLLRRELEITGESILSTGFQKLLLECCRHIGAAFGIDGSIPFRATNMYPAAFMGLFTQTIAIRQFRNNYQYIMHALTGLQRRDGIPLCVGASSDAAELANHFPTFTPQDFN